MALDFVSSSKGFLGLSKAEITTMGKPRAAIIPFGLERTVSYTGGTAAGPQAAIKASHQVELFDEDLWCEPYSYISPVTLKEPMIKKKLEAALEQLEGIVDATLKKKLFPMIIGGEHSLTAGAIRPFAKRHKQLTIVHFDAHADLRDGYDGAKYSHAAALRRCMDHPNVRVVSFGIRNISGGEIPFYDKEIKKDRLHIFWAKDKAQWTDGQIKKAIGTGPAYISFDLDGFDASLMPATGTPEPGGIFWDDAMRVIKIACDQCDIVGADVVELAPIKGLHASDFLTAKLVYKILAYSLAKKK